MKVGIGIVKKYLLIEFILLYCVNKNRKLVLIKFYFILFYVVICWFFYMLGKECKYFFFVY